MPRVGEAAPPGRTAPSAMPMRGRRKKNVQKKKRAVSCGCIHGRNFDGWASGARLGVTSRKVRSGLPWSAGPFLTTLSAHADGERRGVEIGIGAAVSERSRVSLVFGVSSDRHGSPGVRRRACSEISGKKKRDRSRLPIEMLCHHSIVTSSSTASGARRVLAMSPMLTNAWMMDGSLAKAASPMVNSSPGSRARSNTVTKQHSAYESFSSTVVQDRSICQNCESGAAASQKKNPGIVQRPVGSYEYRSSTRKLQFWRATVQSRSPRMIATRSPVGSTPRYNRKPASADAHQVCGGMRPNPRERKGPGHGLKDGVLQSQLPPSPVASDAERGGCNAWAVKQLAEGL